MKMNGIVLYVQDVEKLKLFYTEHFHFTVVEEIPPSWVLLKLDNSELGLHKAGVTFDLSEFEAGENNNVKLIFETEKDLTLLREQLKSRQVQMREIKTWDNYEFWLCDGVDPEGNVFQIKQKK